MFPVALAAALGGALGGHFVPLESWSAAGLSELFAALVVLLAAFLAAARGAGPRRTLALWCLAIGLGFAVRAVDLEGSQRTRTAGTEAGAQLSGQPRSGLWRSDRSSTDGGRGTLVGGGGRAIRLLVEPGSLHNGERIAVRPSGAPLRAARGPVASRRSAPASQLQPVLPDELVRLAPPRRTWLSGLRDLLDGRRQALARRFARIEREDTAGLATALVLGDAGRLTPRVADLFARTGTMHLLAVSGLHVGLVAWLAFGPLGTCVRFLLRRVARRSVLAPWIEDLLRVLLLALYVPLAGARAPVVRAALALAFALLARHVAVRAEGGAADHTPRLVRRPDALTLWSLALLLECLVDPRAPLSTSVGLSYGATLGLILGFRPLRNAFLARLPNAGRVDTVDRLGRERSQRWRVPAQRALDLGTSSVSASLAAVLGGLPVAWATFGEISLAGVLATPLLIPPLTIFLLLGWGHALAPWLIPESALDVLADAMLTGLSWADRIPGTPTPLPPRPLWLVLAVVGLLLSHLRAPSLLKARVCAAGAGIVLLPWSAAPRSFELVALDVGNGTGVVMRAPGLGVLVFDAGSRDRFGVARSALAPLLASWEAGEITVALSHPHRDHCSALSWLVERYRVHRWLGARTAHLDERIPHTTALLDASSGRLQLAFQASDHGTGANLIELARAPHDAWIGRQGPAPGGTDNESSRTLVVTWNGQRLVLSGDAEAEGLHGLLENGDLEGPCRLLLAPHHGSETAHLGALLEHTRPAEVWISSTTPPAVGPELDRRGLPWRWTGRDGPLVLRLPAAPDRSTREKTEQGSPATGTDRASRSP